MSDRTRINEGSQVTNRGCKSQMESFDLYFGQKLGKLLYYHTDNLSKTFQSEKLSAMGGKRLAMLTVDVIEVMRNEESFDRIFIFCSMSKVTTHLKQALTIEKVLATITEFCSTKLLMHWCRLSKKDLISLRFLFLSSGNHC